LFFFESIFFNKTKVAEFTKKARLSTRISKIVYIFIHLSMWKTFFKQAQSFQRLKRFHKTVNDIYPQFLEQFFRLNFVRFRETRETYFLPI